MIAEKESGNFEILKDCLSTTIVQKLAPNDGGKPRKKVKGRKNEIKPIVRIIEKEGENDASELGGFIEYIAEEIFLSLPSELRNLSYSAIQNNLNLGITYSVPIDTLLLEKLIEGLPLSVPDSLTSYSLLSTSTSLERFLEPSLSSYISSTTSPPPEYTPSLTASRSDGCEICEREHIPLTYHHLIPRSMHAKVLKRGWHQEWELQKVAWLCRACHSFVHKIEVNEMLAKEYYSVELLLEREDVRKWAAWVGRVRWKAR